MTVLQFIWRVSSLIIAGFLGFELLVISPLLLLLFAFYRFSIFIAPDVFTFQLSVKYRKIMLCVDPTSVPSINWIAREFPLNENDQVILVHVIEPTESIQMPGNSITFNQSSIDTKDFFIPQYISEFGHWLQRNRINYEGVLMRPLPRCTVAETLLKLAQKYSVDCIVASASERAGT